MELVNGEEHEREGTQIEPSAGTDRLGAQNSIPDGEIHHGAMDDKRADRAREENQNAKWRWLQGRLGLGATAPDVYALEQNHEQKKDAVGRVFGPACVQHPLENDVHCCEFLSGVLQDTVRIDD